MIDEVDVFDTKCTSVYVYFLDGIKTELSTP